MSVPGEPERPARPQYGEYATPEEQRARIRQPDATFALETGQSVTSPAAPSPAHPPAATAPVRSESVVAPTAVDPLAARRRNVDRILTYVLLGYGLFTVLTRIPSYIEYTDFAGMVFSILGIDIELTDPQGAQAWGIAAAIALGVGWLLTAVLCWLRLRAGRSAWWVALLGGVVVNLVAGYLMTVPLMNDPAVWPALQQSLLGGL